MILWILIVNVYSFGFDSVGKIHVSGLSGLYMSITNQGELATYYFEFILDRMAPEGSIFKILFPYQYDEDLGVESLECSLGICNHSSRQVYITLNTSLSPSTSYQLSLSQVRNPAIPGGTGNFALYLSFGSNLLNKNEIFAVLGVSKSPSNFESATVSITSGGSLYAGDVTNYEFRFKLERNLQSWHWLRFIFPSNYQLASYPACSAFAIEGNFVAGVLSCASSSSEVTMTGISADLIAGKEYGVYITATNPFYSGVTGTFTIETGRNLTFTVLDRRTDIEGVTILPGKISDISLKPYNEDWVITKKKKILYRLKFLLKNQIDQGGKIELTFTNSFNLDYTQIREVEYGLEDVSLGEQVKLDYDLDLKVLKIYGFKEFSPVLIALIMEINNPNDAGPSDVIKISSYLKNGVLVDQDTKSSKVVVSIYTSPTSTMVTYPATTGNQATGASTKIRIHFYPQVEIPQLGYIKLNVPDGFNIVSAPDCKLQPTNMALLSSPFCDFLDGVLTIQLYADTSSDFGKFVKGVESFLEISNIIAPESSGWYLFDFNTYSEVWDFLESGLATAEMVASEFTSFNFDVAAAGVSGLTVLMIDFDTTKVIPQAFDPFITTDTQGGIEILLPTMDSNGNLLFDLGLGSGLIEGDTIPCQSISGISENLKCLLSEVPDSADESNKIKITVKDFLEVPTGTNIKFHLSNIYYVLSTNSPDITVTTYKNYNRRKYELETGTSTLNAGITMPAITSTGLNIISSSSKVNSTTDISFSGSLSLSSSTSSTPYILAHINPTHESGYCQYSSPTCSVNSITYPCTCYKNSDIILISLSISLSSDFDLSIQSLNNPEAVSSTKDDLTVYLVSSYQVLATYSFSSGINLLQPGTFQKVKLIVSSYKQGNVNTEYVFEIIPEDYLKQGGSFTINFPSDYSLAYSSPASSCFTRYLPYISQGIKCEVIFNTVSISGFETTNKMFLVFVQGVKNPYIDSTSPFKIRSFSQNLMVIDEHLNVDGVLLSQTWKTQDLEYVAIENFPDNANATSLYRFSITPSEVIGARGIVEITFPVKQFPNLPSRPLCWVVGYVSSIEKCESFKNVLRLTMDQDPPYKILYVDIYGLVNFPAGISDSFKIRTYYDNVLIQENFKGVYLKTTAQASNLQVKSINFYPINEGEISTYVFEFVPKYDIDISSSIVIKFPYDYDQRLGNTFKCFAEGLYGTLTCSVDLAFTLTITSDEIYYACKTCSIKLSIYGIVNPNSRITTGQFAIGIKQVNSFIELNEYSGTLQILPAGDYLDIESILHSSLDSRAVALMSFNLTTSKAIPSTEDEGAIWFTFPGDYPLLLDNFYCTSSSFWSQGVPDCKLYMDTIQTNGQTEEFYGNLFVSFSNLPYPLTEVYAGFITVKVYDGVNFKLLSRTYPNLSPNRLRFTYAGPLIVINNDKAFTVTAGTMSEYIPITLDYPCALNLTLIPVAAGFSLLPSKVQLQTGDVIKYFRVSVPKDSKNETFYIYWTIHGEIEPNYYVPILPTEVKVVYQPVLIGIEQPVPIPRGGISLPVLVTLANAPDSDITVEVVLASDKKTMHLSDSLLKFTSGDTSNNFTIRVLSKSSAVQGSLLFKLTGSNMDSYLLPFNSLVFDVFTDKGLPEVLSVDLTQVSRTSASFTVTTNKICLCLFAYALRGSEVPSFDEVFFAGPAPYESTLTRYSSTRIIQYRQGKINLTDLTKETSYSLFIWLLDLSGFSSSSPFVLDFKTDTRYKAAEVSLYFDQTYLTYQDSALAQSTIALLLSLADWRVILNELESKTEPSDDNSPSSQGRRLSTVKSSLVFTILDVSNSEVYPRPLEMISILSKKTDKLKAILKNFDSSTEIKGVEIYMDQCDFSVYPSVVEVMPHNVTVLASLRQNGFIQAIIVESESQPFAFQVNLGIDYQNRKTISKKVQVRSDENNYLVFEGLEPKTKYFVFLICSNMYPGAPDLISDSNLVKLECVTEEEPELPSLKIEAAGWVVAGAWVWWIVV